MNQVIIQGIAADDFFGRIEQIVEDRVKKAIDAVTPKESPDDLLNYHEIAKTYNMGTISHISRRVSEESIQQHRKDGKVCITRKDAEKLFRKTV